MKIFSLAALLVLSATAPAGVFLTVDPVYTPADADPVVNLVDAVRHVQADVSGYGGDWFGNFTPGEELWEPMADYLNVEITAPGVKAFSFQAQSTLFGGFWTDLNVLTMTSSGQLNNYPLLRSTNGMSTGDADGSATWVGVAVDNPDERIAYLAVRVRPLTMATYDQFAVGNFRYGTVLPVPEPSSLGFFALGVLPFLRRRKR